MLMLAGFFTGMLVGLTGVGGGAVMTPLLLMVFGVAPNFALGTDLLFAAVTKAAAAKIHQSGGLIDWQVVQRLWCGSLPAAAICMLWLRYSASATNSLAWLQLVIAYALMFMALGMLFQHRLHRFGERLRKTRAMEFKRRQLPLTVLAGVLLGIFVSLTSVGAGALGAVMLTYLYPLRLTPSRLVATDIVHAIPLALFSGFGHLLIGNVNFDLLWYLLLGSIPGVILGALLSSRLPHQVLRHLLAWVLLAIGFKLALAPGH